MDVSNSRAGLGRLGYKRWLAITLTTRRVRGSAAEPHFGDQTKLYSRKGWDELHFTPASVKAAAVSTLVLDQPGR